MFDWVLTTALCLIQKQVKLSINLYFLIYNLPAFQDFISYQSRSDVFVGRLL